MSEAKSQKKPQSITQEKIIRAKEAHQYIKAGPKQSNPVTITGAQKQWQQNPDVIYVNAYRLFGTEDQIREVLTNTGVSQEDQDAAISSAYTKDNTVEGAELYQEFLEEQAAVKNNPKQKREVKQYTPDEISDLAKRASNLTIVKAEKPAKKVNKQSETAPKRSAGSLSDKYSNLKEGQYLDVSTIKESGAGSKVTGLPKDSTRSKKRVVPGLSLVSSSAENLEKALNLLQFSQEDVEEHLRSWKASQSASLKPVSTKTVEKPAPVSSAAKAPAKAPAKAVAAVSSTPKAATSPTPAPAKAAPAKTAPKFDFKVTAGSAPRKLRGSPPRK